MPGGLLAHACVSEKLCPKGAPAARCDGQGAIVSCHDTSIGRTTCEAGSHCEEHHGADGNLTAVCEPEIETHAHCAEVGKSRCEGSRLVQCIPHGPFGEVRVVRCADFGLTCDPRAAKGCVLAGGAECEPAAARCEAEALTFCAAGKRLRISCEAIGLGVCDPDGNGLEASCAAGR